MLFRSSNERGAGAQESLDVSTAHKTELHLHPCTYIVTENSWKSDFRGCRLTLPFASETNLPLLVWSVYPALAPIH